MDRGEGAFSRLLSQLPEAGRYRSDDCMEYGLLPRNRHMAGKSGEVNRNEGIHSRLRDRRRLQNRAGKIARLFGRTGPGSFS